MSEKYTPEPVDTGGIELPESLRALAEMIAENVHNVWAKSRLDDGWSYGEKRDDAQKRSPCLVPYDRLPESEKEYDRRTAEDFVPGPLFQRHRLRSDPAPERETAGYTEGIR